MCVCVCIYDYVYNETGNYTSCKNYNIEIYVDRKPDENELN